MELYLHVWFQSDFLIVMIIRIFSSWWPVFTLSNVAIIEFHYLFLEPFAHCFVIYWVSLVTPRLGNWSLLLL